jgi:hypothetical protein
MNIVEFYNDIFSFSKKPEEYYNNNFDNNEYIDFIFSFKDSPINTSLDYMSFLANYLKFNKNIPVEFLESLVNKTIYQNNTKVPFFPFFEQNKLNLKLLFSNYNSLYEDLLKQKNLNSSLVSSIIKFLDVKNYYCLSHCQHLIKKEDKDFILTKDINTYHTFYALASWSWDDEQFVNYFLKIAENFKILYIDDSVFNFSKTKLKNILEQWGNHRLLSPISWQILYSCFKKYKLSEKALFETFLKYNSLPNEIYIQLCFNESEWAKELMEKYPCQA